LGDDFSALVQFLVSEASIFEHQRGGSGILLNASLEQIMNTAVMRPVLIGGVPVEQEFFALVLRERGESVIGGGGIRRHGVEYRKVILGELFDLGAGQFVGVVIHVQFEAGRGDIEHEGGVGGHVVGLEVVAFLEIEFLTSAQILIDMKVDEIESRLKKWSAAVELLDFDGGEATIRDELLFGCKALFNEIEPGACSELKTKWQGVKEQAQKAIAVLVFGAPVTDQAANDIGLAVHKSHDTLVSGEQNSFERNPGLLGKALQSSERFGGNVEFGPAVLFAPSGAQGVGPTREELRLSFADFFSPKCAARFGGDGGGFEGNKVAIGGVGSGYAWSAASH
jgi:hypothetical protein